MIMKINLTTNDIIRFDASIHVAMETIDLHVQYAQSEEERAELAKAKAGLERTHTRFHAQVAAAEGQEKEEALAEAEVPVAAEEPAEPERELDLSDRCDQCGSAAYVQAKLFNGNTILFCGHHGTKYEFSIIEQGGSYVIDERLHIKA